MTMNTIYDRTLMRQRTIVTVAGVKFIATFHTLCPDNVRDPTGTVKMRRMRGSGTHPCALPGPRAVRRRGR